MNAQSLSGQLALNWKFVLLVLVRQMDHKMGGGAASISKCDTSGVAGKATEAYAGSSNLWQTQNKPVLNWAVVYIPSMPLNNLYNTPL